MSVVAVVGLGYVGLPLAVEFGKKMTTIGYDLSLEKIEAYRRFCDPTGEVSADDLKAATQLTVTSDPADLAKADFIIVAVPTPVDAAHIPDFSPLVGSSTTVGQYMKKGATVIYESTVYPGATEEVCIPILEKQSGMKWLQDFHVGYSPERVNPGDKERTITKIVKVVSGDDAATLDKVAELYGSVITAGVHRASSDQGRRGRQGDREHPARPQHRADERALADLRPPRHRHARSAEGRRHQVELPALPPGPGRRPLHRRRSLLPHPQGRHARLPPAGHPRRPPHQRRHGRLRGAGNGEEHDRQRRAGEGRQGQRARPHLQGKLPRPAQLQGGRRHPRTAVLRLRRAACTTRSANRGKPSTNTASRSPRGTTCPSATPSSPPCRTAPIWKRALPNSPPN